MSYKSHAKREFSILKVDKFIQKCVFELLKEFSNEGHSGGSAPYGTAIFIRMAKLKTKEEVEKEFIKIGYKPINKSKGPDKWIQTGTYKLLDIFHKQNHTEESAKLVLEYFKKISSFKPLSPIMCTDDEWNDVSEYYGHETVFQNNRCSAVFKHGVNGKPYYLDAIIWKNQQGITYTGSAFNSRNERITSRQHIKIPFIPKSFYIDRIDYEIKPDDWEGYVKDESQLKEVWKYYEHQETPSYLRLKKLKQINVL